MNLFLMKYTTRFLRLITCNKRRVRAVKFGNTCIQLSENLQGFLRLFFVDRIWAVSETHMTGKISSKNLKNLECLLLQRKSANISLKWEDMRLKYCGKYYYILGFYGRVQVQRKTSYRSRLKSGKGVVLALEFRVYVESRISGCYSHAIIVPNIQI